MSINASFVIMEYIKSIVDNIIDPDEMTYYPGRFTAESSDISAATYNVIQNLDISIPHIKIDGLTVTIYHQKFLVLQQIIGTLLPLLNPDQHVSGTVPGIRHSAIYTAGLDEDIRFHAIYARVSRSDNNNFIEGTEYHQATIDILLQYVEL